ncbi:MAG TPA: SpoIIE family protein phosphatase [Gemmataceae bacterium]|nr:SpoIIE family protein phosphatase [Gemmataceae bacterium]
MSTLVTVQGPNTGRTFSLDPRRSLIGRRPDSTIFLESLAVSREHAQLSCQDGAYFIEDLGSSNGTWVNGKKIAGRVALGEKDSLQIGPYVLALRQAPTARQTESDQIIRTQVNATPNNLTLYAQNPALKLKVVLEIAQHLGRTLDTDQLLNKLLEQLFILFPQADRGMVLLGDQDQLNVRAQRSRSQGAAADYSYSRTVVNKALEEGVGILSEDVRGDTRFTSSTTVMGLNLSSLLCVPLISHDRRRLGVIQLDCSRPGARFNQEDLELLTTLSLQVVLVLDNAALHAEALREQRLHHELAMAREIQEDFLPTDFQPLGDSPFELFAKVSPAREVSGDLYDFFPLGQRLAFLVGDVAGKGMPAAMFMVRVLTLCRQLASDRDTPAQTLTKLNTALAASNRTGLFVTMAYGVYDPATGGLTLASGGHPLPLLRRRDGTVEEVPVAPGRLLGAVAVDPGVRDYALTLAPGETVALYTDGFVESRRAERKEMFGPERLKQTLGGPRAGLSLAACYEEARKAVERFTNSPEQQDDLTLLLLRRT